MNRTLFRAVKKQSLPVTGDCFVPRKDEGLMISVFKFLTSV